MTTLAQLAPREVFGGPFPTGLIRRCRALMDKPLAELTVEDLRVMLGQALCVRHLLPIAVQRLQQDPLAEGDLYPGDLLTAVAKLPSTAWDLLVAEREALRKQLREIISASSEQCLVDDPELARTIEAFCARS